MLTDGGAGQRSAPFDARDSFTRWSLTRGSHWCPACKLESGHGPKSIAVVVVTGFDRDIWWRGGTLYNYGLAGSSKVKGIQGKALWDHAQIISLLSYRE